MKNKVDINKALIAFDVIRNQGVKNTNGFEFEGINAESDFDGYTLIMNDKLSTLTIFFHNKYELVGPDNKAMERLIKNIEHIAAI